METTQGCYVLFKTNPKSSTPIKQQLYGHLPPISQTIQARYTGYGWRSKKEAAFSYGNTSVDQPAKSYIHEFYVDTGCYQADLPGMVANRDGWWESVKGIWAVSTPW